METRDAFWTVTLDVFSGKQFTVCRDLAPTAYRGLSPRHHPPLGGGQRKRARRYDASISYLFELMMHSVQRSHFYLSIPKIWQWGRNLNIPQFVSGFRGRAEGLASQVQQHGPAGAVWPDDRQHKVHVPLLVGQGRARQEGDQRMPLHQNHSRCVNLSLLCELFMRHSSPFKKLM